MNKKRIEIEAKFPLNNFDETIEILERIGKKTEDNIKQKDIYYTPAHTNFLDDNPITKWFRVRNEGDIATINFKDWSNSTKNKKIKCREIEVGIDDYEGVLEILEALDFKKIIVVDKIRTSYVYKDLIFSIDRITDLGNFLEIEYKNNIYETEDESLEYIQKILKELNIKVGNQIFAGYPQLVMEHQKNNIN